MAREMKDSGIEWIGEIPKSWDVYNLRRVFSFGKGLPITKEDLRETGVAVISYGQIHAKSNNGIKIKSELIRYVDEAYLETNPESLVRHGDFIFADTSEDLDGCGNAVFVDIEDQLFAGYHTIILKNKSENDNRYFAFLFQTDLWRKQIRERVSGVKVFSVSQRILRDSYLLVPPYETQRRIADYLSALCTQIDEVIEQTRASIEEYKKLKQAVITQAVTKGIRPDRQMKDSGVEWLGSIVFEWKLLKLKNLISLIESGTSVNAAQYAAGINEIGVLKTSCVSKQMFIATENKVVNKDELERVSCPVKANTIIMSRMNTPDLVGACGYVDSNYPNLFLPDRLWQVHFIEDKVNVKYLWYYLNCKNIRNYYGSLAVGTSSSMQNISQDQLYQTYIPLPTIDEQNELVNYLDSKIRSIEILILNKELLLANLESYKKSLIYEYVTGKKEVPA